MGKFKIIKSYNFCNLKMEEKKQGEKTAEELKEDQAKELQRQALADNNINPLLNNGITNKDIFRTLLFHFKTDNFIPIEKASEFVVNLLKRPCETRYDREAEERFKKSLYNIMAGYCAEKPGKLNEDEF